MASRCVPIELATIKAGTKTEGSNSRHVERNEELEVSAGILSGVERAGDLVGLPIVGSDVESEGVDTVVVGKFDVLQPGVLGVGEGVAHHVVSSHNLVVASPLQNYRNRIAERSERWKVGTGRNNPEIKPLTWRSRNGGSVNEEGHCDGENEFDKGNHRV